MRLVLAYGATVAVIFLVAGIFLVIILSKRRREGRYEFTSATLPSSVKRNTHWTQAHDKAIIGKPGRWARKDRQGSRGSGERVSTVQRTLRCNLAHSESNRFRIDLGPHRTINSSDEETGVGQISQSSLTEPSESRGQNETRAHVTRYCGESEHTCAATHPVDPDLEANEWTDDPPSYTP